MKKLVLLSILAASFPLFTACERQNWEETKMFHDVPKRPGQPDSHKDATKPAPHPEAEKKG